MKKLFCAQESVCKILKNEIHEFAPFLDSENLWLTCWAQQMSRIADGTVYSVYGV